MPVYNRRINLYRPPRFGKHHGLAVVDFEHKKVSWLELFMDLIFVWMIAQLSELAMDVALSATQESEPEKCAMFSCGTLSYHKCHVVHHVAANTSHGGRLLREETSTELPFGMTEPQTLGLSLLLYTLYCWRVWLTEVQMHGRLYDGEDMIGRLLTFILMFATGGMACSTSVGVANAFAFFTFRGSYVIAKLSQLCCLIRLLCSHSNLPGADGTENGARRGIKLLVLSGSVEILLVFLSMILSVQASPEAGLVCFIVSYCISMVTAPMLGCLSKLKACTTRIPSYTKGIPEIHPEHYAERLGLIMIIVLGEAAAHGLNSAKEAIQFGHGHAGSASTRYIANPLALLIIFVQFWLYFDTINEDIFDGKHVFEAAVISLCHLLLLCGFSSLSSAIGILDRSFLCQTEHAPLPSAIIWYVCLAGSIALGSSAWVRVISVRRSLIDHGKYNALIGGTLHAGASVLFVILLCMPLFAQHSAFSILLVFASTSVGLLVFDITVGFRLAPKRTANIDDDARTESIQLTNNRNSWMGETEK